MRNGWTSQRLLQCKAAHGGHDALVLGGGRVHRRGLVLAAGDHRAARRQQRMLGKALRRLAVEAARGDGDGADLGRAVGLRMQRRRPPGGVIGRHVLTFEDDGTAMRRQVVGDGDTGNAGADDGEIEIGHGPHIAWLLARLQ